VSRRYRADDTHIGCGVVRQGRVGRNLSGIGPDRSFCLGSHGLPASNAYALPTALATVSTTPFRGESATGLLGDLDAVDPDGELAASTRARDRRRAERVLDERRHTGGAGLVISNHAITNLDPCHQVPIVPERSKGFQEVSFQLFQGFQAFQPLVRLEPWNSWNQTAGTVEPVEPVELEWFDACPD
jgi:hypothetical protein